MKLTIPINTTATPGGIAVVKVLNLIFRRGAQLVGRLEVFGEGGGLFGLLVLLFVDEEDAGCTDDQ